jgi:hypothetical protein
MRTFDLDVLDYHAVSAYVSALGLSTLDVPSVPRLPMAALRSAAAPSWINLQDGSYLDALPGGFYCIDAETTHGNTVVPMASAYDLVNKIWWVYYSPDSQPRRLKVSGNILGIAHRATFEHSLFEANYSVKGKTDYTIRWLDTHTMASVFYHPAQITLCRSLPHLPLFRESNDLSLKGLAKHLLGLELDKDIVDVFIKASDDSWRDSSFQIHKAWQSTIYKSTAKSLGVKKATDTEVKAYCQAVYPTGLLDSFVNLSATLLPLGLEEAEATLLTKAQSSAPYVWQMTPALEELFTYNLTDVATTVAIFTKLWPTYHKLPYHFTAGYYHRSAPFVPLADQWFEQISVIESQYLEISAQITHAALATQREYQPVSKDGFDISLNKKGQPRWLAQPVTVSSKRLSQTAKLRWNGQVLFTLPVGTGRYKKDGTETLRQQWCLATIDGQSISWAEAVEEAIRTEQYSVFDNPNNTDKKPKDIGCFVTKAFQKYWESGVLTSDSVPYQGLISQFCKISYWQSFRKRLLTQLPIVMNGNQFAAVPRTTLAGTVTGRSICPIMLTMSKPDKNILGSEMYNFIKAPKGYKFVTADLDSIQNIGAAIIAALATAYYGGLDLENVDVLNNEFSRITITGTKEDRTTVPWLLAKAMGLDTDKGYALGKNALYAMLFGAGLDKLALMMKSHDLAKKTLEYFKGTRGYDGKFHGGIASDYFNLLAELANGLFFRNGETYQLGTPKTLFTGRPFPNVLKPSVRGKDLTGTANNAVLQTLDVDCLGFMVTRITEIARERNIPAHFCQAVHDMKQFVVPEVYAEELASVFQEAHREMYTSLLTGLSIDLNSLPEANYQYSGVEITDRWVKSLKDTGKTMSYGGFIDLDANPTDDEMESSDTPLGYMSSDFMSNKQLRAKVSQMLEEAELALVT